MPALTLHALRATVVTAAVAFDALVLDRDAAADALREWSTIAHAAEAAYALAAARVAECGAPPSAGAASAADFCARLAGTTTNKANEAIKAGRGLQQHDKTRELATKGELSADQVAAVTDALTVSPDAEGDLLAAAKEKTVGGLRQECAAAKAVHQDLEAIERRIHAERRVRRWTDADGAEHLHAVGTKRDMAKIDQALKPLVDKAFKKARASGEREPHEAYLFDAFVAMAEGSSSPTSTANPVRNLTVLRIDWDALTRGHVESDETCEIAGLGPISVATAREMLGESILKLVITKGVDVVNVTHLGRGPNIAQKIALLWQQPVCTRKGCGRRARLEYDHRDEFHRVRCTELGNLDPACGDDHDLKTYFGWAFVDGTGVRDMVPPDDPRHPNNRPPP